MKYLILSCCLVLLSALPSTAQPDKGKSLADTFNELLPKLEKDTGAQQKWQDICFKLGAPGNEKQRAEACVLMCAKLDPKTPAAARLWLLTQLEHIGREESVEPLAALLDDKDDVVREATVRALANNPSKTATAKLTAALAKATGKAKIGLLNALGHRADATAVNAIAKELKSDEATAIAAAHALGRIPNLSPLDPLIEARESKGNVHKAVVEALLVHADRLQKSGKDDKEVLASVIYGKLNSPDEPRPVRLAALRGVIQTEGDKAGELILKILAGDDAGEKAVAVGQIESLNAAALKTLAASLDKLPVPSRVSVITAIAARGDRTQLPVALTAAKSTDADVKRAGLLAIGRLGDASVVEFLLEVMTSKDALASVASESLAQLSAEGVDAKLIAVLAKEKTAARMVALIGILEGRKATSAVPELLKSAGGTDGSVRTAAFNALKTLAAPEHVPDMVAAVLKTEKGKERETAELAITAVCSQIPQPEKRAGAVLAAIKNSKNPAELLPLLGRLGGPDALKLIRESLAGSDPALRPAALAGIFNWPDATANDDLLALAEKDKEAATKLAALQALIRINCVLIDRTPEERLAALNVIKKAMSLTTRDDERRAILAGVGFVRHIDTLRFVLPYLDDPALAQAACKGVVELAHSKMLREPNKAEFEKALDRVIAICKDKGLVDRAKQYKEGR